MTALVNEQMNPAQRRVMMLIIERLTQQDQRP
jgi:hypothetical protein